MAASSRPPPPRWCGILDPSQILTELHDGVVNALKKQDHDSETLDGMEIALCSYNLKTNVLEFASARRPLLLITNNKPEVIKGGRFPIGLIIKGDRKYPTHTFKLKPNDTFYIFTDGYCDQFGGIGGKKFMFNRLYRLILDKQNLPMNEQADVISNAIDQWKTGWPQIDDMLVMGVRI